MPAIPHGASPRAGPTILLPTPTSDALQDYALRLIHVFANYTRLESMWYADCAEVIPSDVIIIIPHSIHSHKPMMLDDLRAASPKPQMILTLHQLSAYTATNSLKHQFNNSKGPSRSTSPT